MADDITYYLVIRGINPVVTLPLMAKPGDEVYFHVSHNAQMLRTQNAISLNQIGCIYQEPKKIGSVNDITADHPINIYKDLEKYIIDPEKTFSELGIDSSNGDAVICVLLDREVDYFRLAMSHWLQSNTSLTPTNFRYFYDWSEDHCSFRDKKYLQKEVVGKMAFCSYYNNTRNKKVICIIRRLRIIPKNSTDKDNVSKELKLEAVIEEIAEVPDQNSNIVFFRVDDPDAVPDQWSEMIENLDDKAISLLDSSVLTKCQEQLTDLTWNDFLITKKMSVKDLVQFGHSDVGVYNESGWYGFEKRNEFGFPIPKYKTCGIVVEINKDMAKISPCSRNGWPQQSGQIDTVFPCLLDFIIVQPLDNITKEEVIGFLNSTEPNGMMSALRMLNLIYRIRHNVTADENLVFANEKFSLVTSNEIEIKINVSNNVIEMNLPRIKTLENKVSLLNTDASWDPILSMRYNDKDQSKEVNLAGSLSEYFHQPSFYGYNREYSDNRGDNFLRVFYGMSNSTNFSIANTVSFWESDDILPFPIINFELSIAGLGNWNNLESLTTKQPHEFLGVNPDPSAPLPSSPTTTSTTTTKTGTEGTGDAGTGGTGTGGTGTGGTGTGGTGTGGTGTGGAGTGGAGTGGAGGAGKQKQRQKIIVSKKEVDVEILKKTLELIKSDMDNLIKELGEKTAKKSLKWHNLENQYVSVYNQLLRGFKNDKALRDEAEFTFTWTIESVDSDQLTKISTDNIAARLIIIQFFKKDAHIPFAFISANVSSDGLWIGNYNTDYMPVFEEGEILESKKKIQYSEVRGRDNLSMLPVTGSIVIHELEKTTHGRYNLLPIVSENEKRKFWISIPIEGRLGRKAKLMYVIRLQMNDDPILENEKQKYFKFLFVGKIKK